MIGYYWELHNVVTTSTCQKAHWKLVPGASEAPPRELALFSDLGGW
jgi:hypothetical protein